MLKFSFETKYHDSTGLRKKVAEMLGDKLPKESEEKIDCGIWEERECKILYNDLQDDFSICPVHSVKVAEVEYTHGYYDENIPKYTETETFYITPRILIAWNEGQCATTGVCLDCVEEFLKGNHGR